MNRELTIAILPDGFLNPEWLDTKEPVNKNAEIVQDEIFKQYTPDSYEWLLYAGFTDEQVVISSSLDYWRKFARIFVRELIRTPELELLRHQARILPSEGELREHLESAPPMTGAEYLNMDVLHSKWKALNLAFSSAIQSYKGSVEEFIHAHSPDVHLVGRVFFHLVENKDNEMPFAFLATYSSRLSRQGKSKHLPLKYALQEYQDDQQKLFELLTTVHTAARQSPMLADMLDSGEIFHPLSFSPKEAFSFLKEVPIYEVSGILCRIPNWWKGTDSGLKIDIRIGDKQPSHLGMDAILNFNALLLLGDVEVSEEETLQLLEHAQGLAFIKNKWVAVDPEKLKQVLEAYKKARQLVKMGLTFRDAMRFQLQPQRFLEEISEYTTLSNGDWMESVLKKLNHSENISEIAPGNDFTATLRDYQKKGVNWLYFLHSLKFGACLADDMGLGKTVQLLGFLNAVKSHQPSDIPRKACLLVIPASLISNWMNEIQKFSPALNYITAHPAAHPTKKVEPMDTATLDKLDLVITTYSLVQRYEWLQNYTWAYVILDEAQAIKNPQTKQTRTVKKLTARNRIIMTGTPIENRLSDLWSLFDFINPGLLGNLKEFKTVIKNISNNSQNYARLRKLISPYILRRLKTDKSIISDLPDKVEMKTYAGLSKKQVLLYQRLVEDIRNTIQNTEGIQRKGLILASLMKFKQICNHPDQYTGSGDYKASDSGKFERLGEICETIYEKREKALIFTQFKEMTDPIADLLTSVFRKKGLILHGSTPIKRRKQIIEQFQSREYVPFMVLSLKAGGVGLNLTEANHVIHFDRWWNPAVENQATDRAFRIGQKKNVIVHKFLTQGTVEEKIDRMLEEKSQLSDNIIQATGENWITEMNNDELIDLFNLTL